MSTRCNVRIKEDLNEVWLYRHSDGYPEGVKPTLSKFIKNIVDGKIRNNASQSAGWLILFGADEYGEHWKTEKKYSREEVLNPVHDWKCGAYEPTTGKHGDIHFLYTINMSDKTITIKNICAETEEVISYENYIK
jgi:hypothetical protein